MLHKFLLGCTFLFLSLNAFGQGATTNICNRGPIGVELARQLKSDCSQVSVSKMASYQVIDLSERYIPYIPAGAFDGFDSLDHLYFYGNGIVRIDNGAFKGLKSLRYLSLTSNSIGEIRSDTFEGLTSLVQLHLGVNNISKIQPNSFRGLTSLNYINLTDNQVYWISRSELGLSEKVKIDGVYVKP